MPDPFGAWGDERWDYLLKMLSVDSYCSKVDRGLGIQLRAIFSNDLYYRQNIADGVSLSSELAVGITLDLEENNTVGSAKGTKTYRWRGRLSSTRCRV